MPDTPKPNIIRIDITSNLEEVGKTKIAATIAHCLRNLISPDIDIEVHNSGRDYKEREGHALTTGVGRGQLDADKIIIVDNDGVFHNVEPNLPLKETVTTIE